MSDQNQNLIEAVEKLRREFEHHAQYEAKFQRSVIEQGALMQRVEREIFGQEYGKGLVATVQRMGVQLQIGTWVLGVLGSATLIALVSIFFDLHNKTGG